MGISVCRYIYWFISLRDSNTITLETDSKDDKFFIGLSFLSKFSKLKRVRWYKLEWNNIYKKRRYEKRHMQYPFFLLLFWQNKLLVTIADFVINETFNLLRGFLIYIKGHFNHIFKYLDTNILNFFEWILIFFHIFS